MQLRTQEQVEDDMYLGGIARAESSMNKAEDQGRAYQNPYAKEILRDYVLPLAQAIATELNQSRAGQRQAHARLLISLDPEAVAFLAVRHCLSVLLSPSTEGHATLAYGIGRAVHCELVLSEFEMHNPELYHTLSRDFARRMTKDERHRMTVFRMQAEKAGIKLVEWPLGARNQVGLYLLGLLEAAGLVTIDENTIRKGYVHKQRNVYINPDVMERISQIKSYVAITMPLYGPCVEPPLDWGFQQHGGFHTHRMRLRSDMVHGVAPTRERAKATDMPVVYAAVNALQRTAWQVNTKMLDMVYAIARTFSTKEIVSFSDSPKPPAPAWLKEEWTKAPREEWPPEKLAEFTAWKHTVSDWYTERKILGHKYGRFHAATRCAESFRHYPAIYFVHFADSRGRLYPMTHGLSPQGSDLSKALLRFSEGKPVNTPESKLWFLVQGANKWGFDKATLQDRAAWVHEHHDLIMSFAADPVDNIGWLEAGDPLQFLAWCFEYSDWFTDPDTFLSHLPISMDGSCNGLQNLSAMFRDPIGGEATNLTANKTMKDIYGIVAKAAEVRLKEFVPATEAEGKARDMWLAHGVSRSAVKRSVMTTPYGVTQRTATEYIIDDYLRSGAGPTFDKTEYRVAANVLMKAVWPAIGDVVVKGREAMAWLQKSARVIVKALPKDAEPMIAWDTPSGFPACQSYFESEVHRINTQLHGQVKIRVLSETDEPNLSHHASGLAPNFVHSMDAAHLHLTTAEAARQGITSLAMIHDDYGTHAADAPKLFEIIRRQFVAMYLAFDPVEAFHEKYPMITAPPTKGSLDIMQVLESDFFFS